jgi:hypothetical protein
MKAKTVDKLERQLAELEGQLLDHLRRVLPTAAETGANVFANSQFNPHGLLESHLLPEAERFLSLATDCVSLRDKLGLIGVGSVGELYLSCCAEGADLQNEHRRGPRRLAEWLYKELVE